MKKIIRQISVLSVIIILLILPYFVFAGTTADTLTSLKVVATEKGPYAADTSDTTAFNIAGQVVSVFLSLLGVIFVVLIIYAGYHWMTAHGDEGKVEKAQETIKRAIIGLIITVGAYAIWNLILLSGIL